MNKNIKIKPLNKKQLILYFDRLTRFKYPEIKFKRVFSDIILKNLISPKFSKNDLELMETENFIQMAEAVWNYSVNFHYPNSQNNFLINQKIIEIENKYYKLNDNSKLFINSKLNFAPLFEDLEKNYNELPLNLQYLTNYFYNKNNFSEIKKIVIVEGITEEILLPKFFEIEYGDFLQHGIYIISSGGKNQVARLYLTLREQVKLPIYILLDNDGIDVTPKIMPLLKKTDKLRLISNGEFEDILPIKLILKTINNTYKNTINKIKASDIPINERRVTCLKELFRIICLGEFKKAEFAHNLSIYANSKSDLTSDIREILTDLINL